jgi:hypothetical protein
MENKTISKLGGTCSILLGVSYVLAGLFHTLSPADARLSAGPAAFLTSKAAGFNLSDLVGWSFGLGAVVAIAAIPAIVERFRSLNEDWVQWTGRLALLGYMATILNEFTNIVRWPAIADAYVNSDAAVRAAIVAQPLLFLDPQGWLLYGADGLFVFVVSLLALRANAMPKPLGYVGLIGGALFWLAVIGFVLTNEIIITIAAVLGATILAPIWFIWVGLILRRGE